VTHATELAQGQRSLTALREVAAASRRFDDFVRELARFNERFNGHIGG